MTKPNVVHWVDESGRPAVNVEFGGIDVTVFKSETDNKISVLIDTGESKQEDVRVYMDETVIHGTPLYDIHDIEANFRVVFSDISKGKK